MQNPLQNLQKQHGVRSVQYTVKEVQQVINSLACHFLQKHTYSQLGQAVNSHCYSNCDAVRLERRNKDGNPHEGEGVC